MPNARTRRDDRVRKGKGDVVNVMASIVISDNATRKKDVRRNNVLEQLPIRSLLSQTTNSMIRVRVQMAL
jgi:hypothetical protein